MKRFLLVILAILCALTYESVNAQALVENTSSSTVAVVKNPALQGSTGIESVIYNPAGSALLSDGLHFSLNGVSNLHTIDDCEGNEKYVTKENYFLPSVQMAYSKDKWALSASFASEGGFYSRKSNNLGHLANMMYDVVDNLFTTNMEILNKATEVVALYEPELGSPSFVNKKIQLSNKGLDSHLYNWATRIGAAYEIDNHFSVYAGLKINRISWQSNCDVQYILKGSDGSTQTYPDFINEVKAYGEKISNPLVSTVFDISVSNVTDINSFRDDLNAIFSQKSSGTGIAPVLGLNYHNGAWNVGVKYEFGENIHGSGDKYFSTRSILSSGAQWKSSNKITLSAGGDVYFKPIGTPLIQYDKDVLWDIAAAITYQPGDRLDLSAGAKCGIAYDDFSDVEYIYVTKQAQWYPLSFNVGFGFMVAENIKFNLGAALTSPLIRNIYISDNLYSKSTSNCAIKVAAGIDYTF